MSTAGAQRVSRDSATMLKIELTDALTGARERTRELLAPLDTNDLTAQHSELMSPLVWDLAHIGWYEEYWLLRRLGAHTTDRSAFDEIYDAFDNPRSERASLALLDPDDAWAYCDEVRSRVLAHLDGLELDAGDPLLRDGLVFGLVAQHELQHNETMLQTLQLRREAYPLDEAERIDPPAPVSSSGAGTPREVSFPGGPASIGSRDRWAYDNEQPVTTLTLAPFAIDTTPVSNEAFQEFIADGGYETESLWDGDGWAHIRSERIEAPLGWSTRSDGGWLRRRLGNEEPVPAAEPVQHVSWYEADAYARWAGKRLPTESEWEVAASWDVDRGCASVYPWGDEFEAGRANVGCATFAPSPVGSLAAGASPLGCEQMIGDVWEWTSSDFCGYSGFEAFPYPEYSEVFFGPDYKVLRGGSWATSPRVARTSFRNWDYPIRRQLFAGFRCARDL